MFARRAWSLLPLGLAVASCSKPEAKPGAGAGAPAAALLTSSSSLAAPAPAPKPAAPRSEVALDGTYRPAPALGGRRIFARALRSWIHERPSRTADKLGYFRAGAALEL